MEKPPEEELMCREAKVLREGNLRVVEAAVVEEHVTVILQHFPPVCCGDVAELTVLSRPAHLPAYIEAVLYLPGRSPLVVAQGNRLTPADAHVLRRLAVGLPPEARTVPEKARL
jgi:hypothetical protein